MTTYSIDRIDPRTARAVLDAYGFRSTVHRGRVYVEGQRVPLMRRRLAAFLGVDPNGALTPDGSFAMAQAREMGEL